MVRNIIGWTLLALAVLIAFILITYGGPVFPHIIGPVVFAVIGGGVLLSRRLSPRDKMHGKQ